MEDLRNKALSEVYMEKSDYNKIIKILEGIKLEKINKENLYDQVRILTKRVTSDHSIKRWQIITEWFERNMEE